MLTARTTHRERGVTLLELLVTLVVSGVIIGGLVSMFTGAAADFERAARMREERYARQNLEAELIWRLKIVPPEFLPTSAQIPAIGQPAAGGFLISFQRDDGTGATTPVNRKVLAFDYLHNDTRSMVKPAPGLPGAPVTVLQMPIYAGGGALGCPAVVPFEAAPERITVRTAAIFQLQSVVYVVEKDIVANPNESFRVMGVAGGLAAALTTAVNGPTPAGTTVTPLAVGVDNLDFEIADYVPGANASGPEQALACNMTNPPFDQAIHRRRVRWNYTQFR